MERRKKSVAIPLAAVAGLALYVSSGCGGGATNSAPNPPLQQSLNVQLSPSTLTVIRGSQNSSTLIATSGGAVALAASGLPNGVSLTFDPPTLPGSGSSNLTVAVGSRTPTGTYTILVGGSEDGVRKQATLTLNVLAQVLLTWQASVSADVIGYKVARSEISGGGYVQLNSGLLAETSYTDNSVQSEHTYYYIATAVDSAGRESVASNEAVATVP